MAMIPTTALCCSRGWTSRSGLPGRWSMMRWSFGKLLIIALGGIIPGLSFVVEHFYAKKVVAFLATQDPSVLQSPTPAKGEAA